ncbi:MAG: RES family NAD+ phosphorylase [Gemmatimonadota bacterium]|nr:RES family NAD+ phosphorylase [Gemmatimonadota bacterium]
MHLWRIASGRYDPLDGEGARLAGGRWSSPGRPLVYTSATAALAVLEKLVWTDPEDLPDDLVLFEIDLPDALVTAARLRSPELPAGWAVPGCPECVRLGDEWLASPGGSAALVVPSAVLPEEANVLLNPAHPDARHARVHTQRPFSFDPRLLI